MIGVGGVNLDAQGVPARSLWYLASDAVYVCALAEYEGEWGSSFAVPRVATVVARYLAANAGATEDDVRDMLQSIAQDQGEPGYDTVFGWGYIPMDSGPDEDLR